MKTNEKLGEKFERKKKGEDKKRAKPFSLKRGSKKTEKASPQHLARWRVGTGEEGKEKFNTRRKKKKKGALN